MLGHGLGCAVYQALAQLASLRLHCSMAGVFHTLGPSFLGALWQLCLACGAFRLMCACGLGSACLFARCLRIACSSAVPPGVGGQYATVGGGMRNVSHVALLCARDVFLALISNLAVKSTFTRFMYVFHGRLGPFEPTVGDTPERRPTKMPPISLC